MTTAVRMHLDGAVAVLTLDGPDRLNAFSRRTADELGAAYRDCDTDDAVRVVVLTGAGRAFCAGADLTDPRVFARVGAGFDASPVAPPAWRVRKLVVAAINGHAIGIGLSIAMQCDLRIVAEDARLAIPQVRRGMIGDAQSHHTLRRSVGLAVAAELLLTGRPMSGREAAERGVAGRALPAAEVLPAAMEIAHDVATHASPAAVALSKRVLWAEQDLAEVRRDENSAHQVLMAHPDAVEGAAAWRERRDPRWTYRVSDLPPETGSVAPSSNPG